MLRPFTAMNRDGERAAPPQPLLDPSRPRAARARTRTRTRTRTNEASASCFLFRQDSSYLTAPEERDRRTGRPLPLPTYTNGHPVTSCAGKALTRSQNGKRKLRVKSPEGG